jgi:hypothetical protein
MHSNGSDSEEVISSRNIVTTTFDTIHANELRCLSRTSAGCLSMPFRYQRFRFKHEEETCGYSVTLQDLN